MASTRLPWRHALLALAAVAVWGTNFVIIREALDRLPPLLFAALRFSFAAIPAALFLKRPAVPWRNLAAYGLLSGPGQFGILYMAMKGLISPGLASLVIQSQVFFTIGLSVLIAHERVRAVQWVALGLATAGIVLITLHADATTTPLGLAMVLVAGMSWAGGNMVVKSAGPVNMAAYVAWASLFAAPPLFALSWLVEGGPAIAAGFRNADAATWAAVLWQGYGNVLFGFAAWGWLLARHPAATVTPMALLVPVFGMGASFLVLGEPLPPWKLAAAALVIAGLGVGLMWRPSRKAPPKTEPADPRATR